MRGETGISPPLQYTKPRRMDLLASISTKEAPGLVEDLARRLGAWPRREARGDVRGVRPGAAFLEAVVGRLRRRGRRPNVRGRSCRRQGCRPRARHANRRALRQLREVDRPTREMGARLHEAPLQAGEAGPAELDALIEILHRIVRAAQLGTKAMQAGVRAVQETARAVHIIVGLLHLVLQYLDGGGHLLAIPHHIAYVCLRLLDAIRERRVLFLDRIQSQARLL
mmetsp:Transcript_111135/g.313575  ORF Transcript_111135/g.313575 Transcript_111135/m.313575 type:complete len:225 (+) Transcript_111135:210-884(+)